MERLLVHHARVGDRDGFDYAAAYLVDRPNSVVPELEASGVTCTRLCDDGGRDPRWVLALRALVREQRIDVVHAHSPMPAAMARVALRSMSPRPALVYTEHNTWDCYGWPTRSANAATYRLDDAQLSVSLDAKASVPGLLGRRVEPLTHGIDLDAVREHLGDREATRAALGVGPDDVVVTCVANLRAEKAYDVLLTAARSLLDAHPQVVVLSVGQGPLDAELRTQHERLGLGDRFRFLGFRDDVPSVLAASDVFVLSSRQEGLPVAFMEASVLGLPSVVTRVGGLVDHVDDGVSGLLVAPEQPEALATALGRLVDDPDLRARMGERASSHAAAFDAAGAVRRQEAIYRRVVRRRRAA